MKNFSRIKSKIAVTMIGALLASVTFTGCGSSESATSDEELKTLRIAVMTGQPDYYAAQLEEQQGFYEKHGIKLEFTEYVAGINTIDAVVTGTADIGMMADFATVNRIGNTLADTNLQIISQLSNGIVANGGLYTAPEYAENPKLLDGSKGFITHIGTVTEYYNSRVIETIGIDEANQNIVNTDSSTTSIALAKNGDATAIFASGSLARHIVEQGWVLAVPAKDLNIESGSYWLTTKEFNSENQELIGEFLKASQEAFDYITNNLDSTAAYFEGKTGVNQEDFKAAWNASQHKVGFTEEGAVHLESIEKWGFEHGKYPTDYDIREFIDVTVAKTVVPDHVTIKE